MVIVLFEKKDLKIFPLYVVGVAASYSRIFIFRRFQIRIKNRDVKTCRFSTKMSIKMSLKVLSNRYNISLDFFIDISICRH
jgi:hypothetical protein